MKVIQRETMKVLPGKMAEAMKLVEKHTAITSRLGAPPWRGYRLLSGRGEYMHTLVFETEWDSLAAMEPIFEKMLADPEMQALVAKWDAILESNEFEIYTPLS